MITICLPLAVEESRFEYSMHEESVMNMVTVVIVPL